MVKIWIVATMLGVAGCSGEDARRDVSQPVAATVAKLQDALAAKDWRTICRHLTRPAHQQAGSLGHGLPTAYCSDDVRRAFGIIDRGAGWSPGKPVVERVDDGARGATATVTSGGWKADIPFVERSGSWKLDGFFGAAPAAIEAVERAARRRPFPEPEGRPVAAVDGLGEPCSDLDARRYPAISGGCRFDVAAESAPIRILTPFGAFKFADCRISYRVSTDATGRTWTNKWSAGDVTQTGCSDINLCNHGPFDRHPWKGQLAEDPRGGYLHVMHMCLRTCVGAFAGKLVMRLTRRGGSWRVQQTDRDTIGFKVDGPLGIAGDGFDLR